MQIHISLTELYEQRPAVDGYVELMKIWRNRQEFACLVCCSAIATIKENVDLNGEIRITIYLQQPSSQSCIYRNIKKQLLFLGAIYADDFLRLVS